MTHRHIPTHARALVPHGVFTTLTSTLLVLINLAIVACAVAQQPAKLPKVAIMSPLAPTAGTCGPNFHGASLPCFMDAMRELGYVDVSGPGEM